MLSIDANHLPDEIRSQEKRSYRKLIIDGEAFEFSDGHADLHTQSYENILAGRGFPISESRKSIDLVHKIRSV